MRSTELRRALLVLAVTLAGCASPPPPPPTISINRPKYPVEDPQARQGSLDTQAEESASAGVRGMNYDELLSCMKRKLALKTIEQQLKNGVGAINAQKKSISATEAAIETSRSKINFTSQDAVDGFNNKVNAHHESVRTFNQSIDHYNAEVAKMKTQNQAYTVGCVNRPFKQADAELLPTELQAVSKENVSSFDLPVYFDGGKVQKAKPSSEEFNLDDLDLN